MEGYSILRLSAKVTNATHTGDVTGATALTIATDAVDIAMLSATGTASATTFLRGDNAWASAGAQVKVGEFNYVIDTSSGTQAITGVGFQPIALWIFAGPDRGTSPPPVFGGSDGTTDGNVASIHPTADHLWDANTSNLIDIETSAGNTATAVLTSFDADGFTLTWTKTGSPPTQTILINYWAVK